MCHLCAYSAVDDFVEFLLYFFAKICAYIANKLENHFSCLYFVHMLRITSLEQQVKMIKNVFKSSRQTCVNKLRIPKKISLNNETH